LPKGGLGAPLYTDEHRLTEKVLSSVRRELGLKQDPVVTDVKRLGDGGVSLTLHYIGEEIEQQDIRFREDKTLVAEADHRGQIIKIEETEVRQSKVEVFQVPPVLDAAKEILGIDKTTPLIVSSMKRNEEGEVSLVLVHQGKRWIAKADRWSRLVSIEESN
jgi:hypothetical protein